MMPIIDAKGISFGYREGHNIFAQVDFSIYPGQLISLLGPNGVGKSTLLNCICGLLKPQCGEIALCGRDISKETRKNIAQKIAYVPQKTSVSFDYSVKKFVVMGRTAHMNLISTPSREDYDRANEAMEELALSELADRPISELSGGEQQKACIARALVQTPKLIVLDEPTSALDFGNQIKVLKLIRKLSDSGYAILMTTHNPDHCIMLGGKVAILDKTGSLEIGNHEAILTETKLSKVYGTDLRMVFVDDIQRTVCVPAGLE
ncbi:MAG: ABC transporter ATP-binding protein [Oscillospiraceae bacterium]